MSAAEGFRAEGSGQGNPLQNATRREPQRMVCVCVSTNYGHVFGVDVSMDRHAGFTRLS